MTHDSIKNVAFPAVTVCYPLSLTKGYSVTQAFLHFDPDGQVLDLLKDSEKMKEFKASIDTRIEKASNTFLKTEEFKGLVNGLSYKALENLIGEDLQEVAYLLHFLSYNLYQTDPDSDGMMTLMTNVIENFNRMQWERTAAEDMKQPILDLICDATIEGIDVGQLCQDVEDSDDTETGIDKYCNSDTKQVSGSKLAKVSRYLCLLVSSYTNYP